MHQFFPYVIYKFIVFFYSWRNLVCFCSQCLRSSSTSVLLFPSIFHLYISYFPYSWRILLLRHFSQCLGSIWFHLLYTFHHSLLFPSASGVTTRIYSYFRQITSGSVESCKYRFYRYFLICSLYPVIFLRYSVLSFVIYL